MPRSGDTLDPDLKPARTNVFDAGTEIALSKDLTLGVGYVHRTVSHINEDTYVLQANHLSEGLRQPGEGMTTQPYGSPYPVQPMFERNYDGVDFQLGSGCPTTGRERQLHVQPLEGTTTASRIRQQMLRDVNPNLRDLLRYLRLLRGERPEGLGRLSADARTSSR